MEILNPGNIDINKRTIYIDVDDVILKSSEQIIRMLQRRYNINKTIYDLRDWKYKSIYKNFSKEDLILFFKSEEFWKEVEYNKELIDYFEEANLINKYNLILVTKGTKENLEKKYEYLYDINFFKKNEKKIGFIGIDLEESKSKVKMLKGIQIDDSIENLIDTDATLKILLTNGLQTNYNHLDKWPKNIQNFYVVNMTEELIKVLEYELNDGENLTELEELIENTEY